MCSHTIVESAYDRGVKDRNIDLDHPLTSGHIPQYDRWVFPNMDQEIADDPESRNEYIRGWMDAQRPVMGLLPKGLLVSCLQDSLKTGLDITRHAINSRSTLPILQHVLLEIEAGRLVLTTTNLDLTIRVSIGSSVIRDGSTMIPHKDLYQMVKLLSPERVDLESGHFEYVKGRGVVGKDWLSLKCGTSTVTLKGLDPNEFPTVGWNLDHPENAHAYTIRDTVLIEAINAVEGCAASDDSRPILLGISLKSSADGSLDLTTADGFRVAHKTIQMEAFDSDYEFDIVVPATTLATVVKIVKSLKLDDLILVRVPENDPYLYINAGQVEFVIRVIEGTFPDWTRIVPKNLNASALIDREDLIRQVKRAGVIAQKPTNTVILVLDPDHKILRVNAKSAEIGDFEGVLSAQITGQSIDHGVNYKYLLGILNMLTADQIRIRVDGEGASRPLVLEPATDETLLYLVMPMHIER